MCEEIYPVNSSFVTGRIIRRPKGAKLQVLIDGSPELLVAIGSETEFSIPLPSRVFDGANHEISARIAGEPGYLKGCPLRFQSNYQGYVQMEPFSGALLTGWAIDHSRPATVLTIEILLHGRTITTTPANVVRHDVTSVPQFARHGGFTYKIENEEEIEYSSLIQARILGTQFELQGSPVLYLDTSRFLKTINSVNGAFRFLRQVTLDGAQSKGPDLRITYEERMAFCDLLFYGNNLAEMMEISRWFQTASDHHISSSSYRHRFYTHLSDTTSGAGVRQLPVAISRIDVVVYIDSFEDVVMNCFRRLLASPAKPAFSVIVVVEAGVAVPGLRDLEKAHSQVSIIENQTFRGFAESLNQAISLNHERDVVILSCKTLVAANWLEHLYWAATNSPSAGIVAPFSTEGEISCYQAGASAAVQAEVSDLAKLSADVNTQKVVDVPAVYGLCAYIRRACINEIGMLVTMSLASNQLVIVDFCLRAALRGWRTLLAAASLVETPIGPDEPEVDLEAFDHLHPYFGDMLVNFHVDDPALECRRNIDLAVIKTLKRPTYCFLTHRFGGGTERHVRDLCAALDSEGFESLVIFSLDSHHVSIEVPRLTALASLYYDAATEFDSLCDDLSKLNIIHFHIHSNVDIPERLLTLPGRLGVAYDCTVHDYSWFCPRVNLIDDSGRYCGEPSVASCNDCVRSEPLGIWDSFLGTYRDVADLRKASHALLSGARRVFCPSEDTKLRIARQFGLHNLLVRRNLEALPPIHVGAPRKPSSLSTGVAVIGYLSRKKGMDILIDCAREALRAELPLHFVVIGFTEDDQSFDSLPNVTITGRYQEDGVVNLIHSQDVRIAFFPNLGPETHSYTLSIAFNCGLFPIAFDLGAVSERIRARSFGQLLPLDSSPEEINAALLEGRDFEAFTPILQPTHTTVKDHYYFPEGSYSSSTT